MPEPQTTGARGATKRSTLRCDPPIIRPISTFFRAPSTQQPPFRQGSPFRKAHAGQGTLSECLFFFGIHALELKPVPLWPSASSSISGGSAPDPPNSMNKSVQACT